MAAAIAPFAPVAGAVLAPVALTEDETIHQTLFWIGFVDPVQRNNVINDSLGSYANIRMLSEKDISSMSEDWQRRTVANGRIMFGTRRTKLLKALTHWVHNFYRISDIPHVDGLNHDRFREHLLRALARAEIRKTIKDGTSSAANAASPGRA